jgi:alcohol dehydrogenase class IV
MWFFSSPQIIHGEGALSYLERLPAQRACIVTDPTLARLGLVEQVRAALPAGIETAVYAEVEPEPSLETVQRGAEFLLRFQPDWIVALGGGSVIDAAKAMWVLYERPDLSPDAINPVEALGLRVRARLCAIPTTTGTGSEATWAIVLTDPAERRKLGLGSRENLPDLAILDPSLVLALPPRLTADTGLDALTHAVEGYTSAMRNDFCDGLCLQAAKLVFEYLPRAVADGADLEARTHTQNAAAMAGLGFGNSMAGLAHGMGHALGAVFHIPHGRAVSLCLPYTIEYCLRGDPTGVLRDLTGVLRDPAAAARYAGLARFLGLSADNEDTAAAACLVEGIRALQRQVGQPLTLEACGVARHQLEAELDPLTWNALGDSQTVMSTRIPDDSEMRRLFWAVFEGTQVDF